MNTSIIFSKVNAVPCSTIRHIFLSVFFISVILISCTKDEDNTLKSNDSERPYDPGNTTDAAMAAWLVGTWGYSNSSGNFYIDNMYEFKEDGTFYKILSSGTLGGRQATAYSGKYRISGNKITLYRQLKSTGLASATHFDKIWYIRMDSYDTKDVPDEDCVYEISRRDVDKLRIGPTDETSSDYIRGK